MDSQRISRSLATEDFDLSGYIYSMITSLGFSELVEDPETFSLQVKQYEDYDGEIRVAVGLAFIQDLREGIDPDLNDEVLKALRDEVIFRRLNFVFNDITINGVQWRDDDQ